jgi:hypothetical protein
MVLWLKESHTCIVVANAAALSVPMVHWHQHDTEGCSMRRYTARMALNRGNVQC